MLSLALIALTTAAPSAAAQGSTLAGRWTVEAAYSGCSINGHALVTPGEISDTYRAALTLRQTCASGRQWDATQSCLLTTSDAHILVACTLIAATPSNYRADNFVLEQRSATLLEGTLQSHYRWTTRWVRSRDLLS